MISSYIAAVRKFSTAHSHLCLFTSECTAAGARSWNKGSDNINNNYEAIFNSKLFGL